MEDRVTCAERIREALAAKQMTQADLCRLTGIPKSAMSQYCNGGLVPRQDRTFSIASALNVSEAWIMGFDVPMEREAKTSATISGDGLDEEVMNLFSELSPEGRASVADYIRYVAEKQ